MSKKQIIALTMLLALTTARGADIAISALPAASSLNAADVIPLVQSGTTKKASFTVQKSYWDTFYQSLDGDLTALSALTGTHTIYYRSAASTWTPVTIGNGLNFTGATLAVNTPTPTPTATPTATATATATATPTPTPTPTATAVAIAATIGFTTDGGGGVITTGTKGYFTAAYGGTITGWSISATGSGPTCTIDVWKIGTGTALPTVTNTIMGTKPALSTGNAKRGACPADCSSWTTTFSAGDIFGFNVDAVTVATKITFALEVTH